MICNGSCYLFVYIISNLFILAAAVSYVMFKCMLVSDCNVHVHLINFYNPYKHKNQEPEV